jgi:NADH-quinone oxidoreductase subunit N
MNYQLLLPQIFLFVWAILIFVLDLAKKERKHNLAYVALLGLVVTVVLLGLILLSMVGMMFLACAGELLTLYVSLELATIPLFVLAAFRKDELKSSEAGLKYLILGAVSSALLLYGISLIYGLTGTTHLSEVKSALIVRLLSGGDISAALVLGFVFMIAGLGFKLALVPFHMWVPDVYEGAPTPITAFLSVASKAAGIAAFVRVFFHSFLLFKVDWVLLMAVLAALAMIIGNVIALLQGNIKRMLAYSSIAQIGYILLGVVAASSRGAASVFFYTLVYLFANMGAFIVAIAFSNQTGSDEIADYAGLSRRSPALAAMMAVFMLSLIGIPPLAGFVGKYYLFSAAIEQGLIWLVIVAVLTSVVSLYYYIGVVRQMYFRTSADESPVKSGGMLKIALLISVIGVLLFGVYPNIFLDLANQAAMVFLY